MNILAYLSGYDGCGFYRLQSPAKYLNRIPNVTYKIATVYSKEDIAWSDIVILQKQTNQQALPYVQYAKQLGKKVVSEVDDCYFSIPTWNPAYTYFKDRGQDLINFYKSSDAITVTTDFLAERLSEYCKNVFVLPNSIDFEIVDKLKNLSELELFKYTKILDKNQKLLTLDIFKQRLENKIKIFWGGSPTHKKDLDLATPALQKICKENKNVVLIMGACTTDTLLETIPEDQLYLIGPTPIYQWSQVLYSVPAEIGICPIESNLFNFSKSNLKYLEFSINSRACVCSNVENYKKTITHGENGLLADNTTNSWYENLNLLVKDESLRLKLGANAQKLIRDKYSMSENIYYWNNCYEKVLKIK